MYKRMFFWLLIAILVVLGFWFFAKDPEGQIGNEVSMEDPLNTSYYVEGETVSLFDGKAENEFQGDGATKVKTSVFGEPVYGDLNGDGTEDAGLILVQETGGTGVFYYLTGALNKNSKYEGLDAIFLGDRIAPQNVEIKEAVLIANYAEREAGQSFAEAPSVGVSKYLGLEGEKLRDLMSKDDLIKLISPIPNTEITSPLTIRGEARGNWFFEASFPIILTDWDGLIIAEGYATAKEDWMTEEYVPFEATIEFEKPTLSEMTDFGKRGSLILKKDNPSGLPENDNALELPVKFAE